MSRQAGNGDKSSHGGQYTRSRQRGASRGDGYQADGASQYSRSNYGRKNYRVSDDFYNDAAYGDNTSTYAERHYGQQGGGGYEPGRYSRANYSSRSDYARKDYSRKYSNPQNKKKTYRLAAIIILILVAIGFGGFWYYHTLPIKITVNQAPHEVSYKTTYEDLHTAGYLVEKNGNLLAVDGSVLEAGAGEKYLIYDKGEQVGDYNARLKKGAEVTEARGPDKTEEYTVSEVTVPFTVDGVNAESFNFYNGSLHFYVSEGQNGIEKTHTGKISGKSVVSETSVPMIPRTFLNQTAVPPADKKVIALTFDDGPSNYTAQVLETLAKYNAKATFFALGSSVEEYPDEAKAVVNAGCQLASHGYNHGGGGNPYMDDMTAEQLQTDLTKSFAAIKSATGIDCSVVRPSGGNLDGKGVLNAGTLVSAFVGWDIDTMDWSKPGVASIVSTATGEATSGAVVLMHDGGGDRTQTVAALDQILSSLTNKGFTFVTIDELLQIEKDQFAAKYA